MMKWRIPAKTFLLGEYLALTGAPAILLTTEPCFEMTVQEGSGMIGIHPESPAGRWWLTHNLPGYELVWHDPYQGCGGLGASSAQFLGAYLASCHLLQLKPNPGILKEAFWQCAWNGEGLRPSAYDVVAQSQNKCVYIDPQTDETSCYDWVFPDLAFLLLHSGQKLSTHYYLKSMNLPRGIDALRPTMEQGKKAFEQGDSGMLIAAVNTYQRQLTDFNLTAKHSIQQMNELSIKPDILAVKGCGAMGADVLLALVPRDNLLQQQAFFEAEGWTVLASNKNLYTKRALIKKNTRKTLEILS